MGSIPEFGPIFNFLSQRPWQILILRSSSMKMAQMLLKNCMFGDMFAIFLVLTTKEVSRTRIVCSGAEIFLEYPARVLSLTVLGVK